MKYVCVRDIISDSNHRKAKHEMVIEAIEGNIKDYPIGSRIVEKITLGRDRLSQTHQKIATDSGEVFALSLRRGSVLEEGDVLYADEKRIVAVKLASEDALLIRPLGKVQWARAAYNIGNMHHSAFIQEEQIVTPYDAILEAVMRKLKVACERKNCPIDGIRAGISHRNDHHHHKGADQNNYGDCDE